jgi:2-polyprenyl-3-methyl-5-hydroxy-6-metoxy-1,4-benzoquinol methylase
MHVCPTKFLYVRGKLQTSTPRILDIGCGNNSPSTTKKWFPGALYEGADIQQYNLNPSDLAAMDQFYLLGIDGSGYSAIPDSSYDLVILHHVVEHMPDPSPILATICAKLKPGGLIWIAFPSLRSLSLPSGEGTLQFCDDPTHVYVPGIREISNVLLSNDVKVLHAGRSRSLTREVLGAAILPWALLRKMVTGTLSGRGLWYLLGFEDHVLGQRRPQSNTSAS